MGGAVLNLNPNYVQSDRALGLLASTWRLLERVIRLMDKSCIPSSVSLIKLYSLNPKPQTVNPMGSPLECPSKGSSSGLVPRKCCGFLRRDNA